jgi:acetolactate synthase-1/2/3 large subunit
MILGGGDWSAQAQRDMLAYAEAARIPICALRRCRDYIPNDHPLYGGHFGIGAEPALARRLAEADQVIAMGARLGEMTTGGYTRLSAPRPAQRLIHVYTDPEELGRVYQADLPLNAGLGPITQALRDLPVDAAAS